MTRSLILDTETNGIGTFRPARQRIVQWSWITPSGEERNYFIQGAADISEHVPHDITVDYLNQYGTQFDVAFQQFLSDLKECDRIVAHNVSFDVGCIRNELKIRNYSESTRDALYNFPQYCTMKESTEYCGLYHVSKNGTPTKSKKWPRLEELYFKLFQETPDGTLHDSLWDCRILSKCLDKGVTMNVFKA